MAGIDLRARCALAVALAFIWTAPGCGSSSQSGKVGSQPSWRRPSEMRASPAKVAQPLVFAPATPAVEAYNDPPRVVAPSSELGDAIVAAIAETAEDAGLPVPVADGRLFAAADELASVVPEDAPLAYPLVEFALQRQGIIEPSPHMVVIWGPLDEPEAIVEQLTERLPSILATGPFARVGVGMSQRKGDEGVAILALQASHIETSPIPRSLGARASAPVEGQVLGSYVRPEVFITREDGTVERPRVVVTGRAFESELSCDGHRGRQQVEITAIDDSGSTVLANFPVWCGESPPTQVTVHATEDDLAPVKTEREAEERMFQLVNRDRESHGLPPLDWDPRVAAVARAHSTEMHDTGVVAHVSPTTGSAADRVRAAGIRTAVVLENVARAYGVVEAEAGLMNSPGHRANLLSEHTTHIGVGIVFGEEVAGRREMFVTQVFSRVPPALDPSEARSQIIDKIAEGRELAVDQRLSAVARRYAADLVGGVPTEKAAARARASLDGERKRFRRITSVVTTIGDVVSFNPDTIFTSDELTHYGIGVAQGEHEVLGENAIYVVLLVAIAR